MKLGRGDTASYDAGVRYALDSAGLYFASVTSVVQLVALQFGAPDYPRPGLVWAAFALHAIGCAGALLRRWPPAVVLLGWGVVAITVTHQLVSAGVVKPVAPGNISMTIAAATAMLLALRPALVVTAATSLAVAATVVLAARPPTLTRWGVAIELVVFSMSMCLALSLGFRELQRVAGRADEAARARLNVDRSVRRKEIAAEAERRRARTVHDTVVNTLGAIANSRLLSTDGVVARRCAEDARTVEALRDSAATVNPSVAELSDYARDRGVDLLAPDIAVLQRQLEAEEPWRRREIVMALRELITNVAKHAGASTAVLSFDPRSATITVADDGVGMADTAPLTRTLSERAVDAEARVEVTSAPGRGTTVRLNIGRPRESGGAVFATASARMARAITGVLLAEFAVVALVIVACLAEWTVPTVLPPLAMWVLLALVLTLILQGAKRSQPLPAGVVAATYLGLAAILVVYRLAGALESVCGVQPNLVWPGDVVAIVCTVLVLVDGRAAVVLPAVGFTGAGIVVILGGTATGCGGSTLALFLTDALVIGAFYVLRGQTLRLSGITTEAHRDQVRRREEQERRAVAATLDDDGFSRSLAFSRDILRAVADRPARVRDRRVQESARLEEGYLRALVGLTSDVVGVGARQRFVAMIDSARDRGVAVGVHAEPGVLDDESAGHVVTVVAGLIERCVAGEDVSVGIYRRDGLALMAVVPPRAAVGYPHAAETAGDGRADVIVTAELGLVEVRWSDGARGDRR